MDTVSPLPRGQSQADQTSPLLPETLGLSCWLECNRSWWVTKHPDHTWALRLQTHSCPCPELPFAGILVQWDINAVKPTQRTTPKALHLLWRCWEDLISCETLKAAQVLLCFSRLHGQRQHRQPLLKVPSFKPLFSDD